jgi:hypothetical protein
VGVFAQPAQHGERFGSEASEPEVQRVGGRRRLHRVACNFVYSRSCIAPYDPSEKSLFYE